MEEMISKANISILDRLKGRWQSPGWVEDLGIQVAYAQFVKQMDGKPLSEWPEHYEGFVHHVYIFYDSGTNDNKALLAQMKSACPKTWKVSWWSSDRFGRHEFRVPLKPNDREWKIYYGKIIDDEVEEIAENMQKNMEADNDRE